MLINVTLTPITLYISKNWQIRQPTRLSLRGWSPHKQWLWNYTGKREK